MFGIDFANYALGVNLVIFAIVAALIWAAGTRISYYADELSARTGFGQAAMGMVFLAVATSMPEIGTTVSAGLDGNAELATNNIYGGITLQTVILAVADFWVVRGALTFFSPRPVLLLEGTFLMMLTGLALAATAAGELFMIYHVGLWSVILLATYLVSVVLIQRYERQERWKVTDQRALEEVEQTANDLHEEQPAGYQEWPLRRLMLFFGLGTLVIFVAGFILARVAEALAQQTGLGSSFVGVTLLAASTSLPELSTTLSAARLGNYSMAVSNIFGSNALMIMLVFVADVTYRDGPILDAVGASSLFAAAMGIVVTAIYLAGLIEWKNRTILGMGVDSAVIFIVYLGSLGVLYGLR